MDLYHSRLTPDNLNYLIIKYRIPRDLHPRLPSEEFVMSELLDDAIGIYHRIFDFSSVRIPFSSHPNAAIDDPMPAAGSFNMADMRRLSAHVIKLRDMPEGADGNVMGIHDFLCLSEWTGAEVQEDPHLNVRPTLQRLPFYCIPKAKGPSTSGAALSHVAKHTRSALAQSSGSTTRPSLFVGDDDESDDDDDACVEIPLVTPLHSATVIPSSRNQGGSSIAPTGKGIMVDDVVAPSFGVSRPRPSFGPAPSFKDVSGDAIHTDFFPFSIGPYYATYPEGGVAGNCEFTREEWDAPYRPTFGVLTKDVFKDPTICKIMVDQFPTPGEMVRVKSLSDDHCEDECTSLYDDVAWWLKGYEEKVANITGLELQVAALKNQVSGLNDKLTSSDASFAKSKAKGNERKKNIKSLGKSLYNLHAEVARLSAALNQATILEDERDEKILRLTATPLEFSSFFRGQFQGLVRKHAGSLPLLSITDMPFNKISEHATEPLLVILQLEPEKLVRPANVPLPIGTRVSPHIVKESTVTPVSESLELSANVKFTASTIASEHNEEMGISVALDDVAELVEVGSGRVPSGLDDVVVALSAHKKGDGLDSSSIAGEEAAASPLGGAMTDAEDTLVALSFGGKLTVSKDVLLSYQRILSMPHYPRSNGFTTLGPVDSCPLARKEVESHPELTMLRVCIIVTCPTEFDFITAGGTDIAKIIENWSKPEIHDTRWKECTRDKSVDSKKADIPLTVIT
ncbi:hypothetical protein Tco_0020466 [Tanacetum coccineum]